LIFGLNKEFGDCCRLAYRNTKYKLLERNHVRIQMTKECLIFNVTRKLLISRIAAESFDTNAFDQSFNFSIGVTDIFKLFKKSS